MESILTNISGCAPASIYAAGVSFVLGSLFTVSMLLVLDFMREHVTRTKGQGED